MRALLLFSGIWAAAQTESIIPPGQSKYDFLWGELERLHLKYGDIRESGEMPDLPVLEQGKFVGETVRIIVTLVEVSITDPDTLNDPEVYAEIQRFMGSLYSLKPLFIMMEEYDSNPAVFAEFETGIIAEIFQLSDNRLPRIQKLIHAYKLRVSELDPNSEEWKLINKAATEAVLNELSKEEKDVFAITVNLLKEHGVLSPPLEDVEEG